jgi:hypothetical protein
MHVFTLRLDQQLWERLQARARKEKASVNCQAVELIEAGLLDSTVTTGPHPVETLPWLSED